MHCRTCLRVALAAALILGAAGCTSEPGASEAGSTDRVLDISGSSACMPLLKILADGRDIEGVEWRFLDSPGSGSGIQGVAGGALAIGAVSRAPNADEEDLDLVYTNLSNDGVVFALHPSVGIDNLTSQQVRDIYAGVYTNWMELGGPDLPIVVLDRHEDEPSKAIMREYVFGDDLVISPRAAALYTEADMVKGLESTVGAIGYYSLGFGTSSGVAAHYPALDGVVPSVASIRDGSYHVVRPLGIVTASDPAPEVAAFVEWATSDEAKDLMESEGFAAAW